MRSSATNTPSAPRRRVSLRMDQRILILGHTKASGAMQYLRSSLRATNANRSSPSIAIIPSQWGRVASTMDNRVQIPRIPKACRSIYSRSYTIYQIKRFIIWRRATLLEITEFRFIFRAWRKFRSPPRMQRLWKVNRNWKAPPSRVWKSKIVRFRTPTRFN